MAFNITKDKDKRKDKGRRCCLGDRFNSVLCRASCFALEQFEEYDELHQDDLNKRINSAYSLKSQAWQRIY